MEMFQLFQPFGLSQPQEYLSHRSHGDVSAIPAIWAIAATGISQLLGYRSHGMSQLFQTFGLPQPWGFFHYLSYLGYRSHGDISVQLPQPYSRLLQPLGYPSHSSHPSAEGLQHQYVTLAS